MGNSKLCSIQKILESIPYYVIRYTPNTCTFLIVGYSVDKSHREWALKEARRLRMKPYEFAVLIMRGQPFHNAHLKMVEAALTQADKLILVLGSHRAAPNTRNPFSSFEREEMIRNSLTFDLLQNTEFTQVRDYYYNVNTWIMDVQTKVKDITSDSDSVVLVGHRKRGDTSTEYLDYFPQWDFYDPGIDFELNATDIRESLFSLDPKYTWKDLVPKSVAEYLMKFRSSEKFARLVEEYKHLQAYKKAWEPAPYAPTFVTTDCVVIKSGHVLVVRRGAQPGKGLLALPGGFLNQHETILDGAIRELKEETGIRIPPQVLRDNIKDSHVFDAPNRSLRGRTISHGFFIDLGTGQDMPKVKGSDDAEKSFWLPLSDVGVYEDQFFEDHVSIIRYFVSRV